MAVDHHLLDLGIDEELLERTEAGRLAHDQVGDQFATCRGEHRRLLGDQLRNGVGELAAVTAAGGRVRAPALGQPAAQLGGERLGVVIDGRHVL